MAKAKTNDESPNPHLFVFDLDRAIRAQVIEALDKSPLLPLTKGVGPKLSGIYALYWKGELTYIGKATKALTKSKRDLRSRLNEHVGKIETRQNITLAEMQCRFLTFESEWRVIAAEYALIITYNPEWNNSKLPNSLLSPIVTCNRTRKLLGKKKQANAQHSSSRRIRSERLSHGKTLAVNRH